MAAINIEWDVNSINELMSLPTSVDLPNGIEIEDISDYLKATFKCNHKGFCIKVEC